jgi:hypothetical protein
MLLECRKQINQLLRGNIFETDNAGTAVKRWWKEQDTDFYGQGTDDLVSG